MLGSHWRNEALIQSNSRVCDSSTPCIRVSKIRGSQRVDNRDAKSASSDNCSGCPPKKERWPGHYLQTPPKNRFAGSCPTRKRHACPGRLGYFATAGEGWIGPQPVPGRARVGVSDAVWPSPEVVLDEGVSGGVFGVRRTTSAVLSQLCYCSLPADLAACLEMDGRQPRALAP